MPHFWDFICINYVADLAIYLTRKPGYRSEKCAIPL